MFAWQTRRDTAKTKNSSRARLRTCAVERLESRDLLSVAALADITASPAFKPAAGKAVVGSVAQGYIDPAQLWQAYGFNQLGNFSGNLPADGRGQTIAIVDAMGDPNIAADLQYFDSYYGLPSANFQAVDLSQGKAKPDPNWAIETALDVEWAHAVAPGAKILLVETLSDEVPDLLAGVQYARQQSGVSVVSMSWACGEFPQETSLDSYFALAASDPGVTFIASAGDNGAPATWPAAAANVLSVGGTTLQTDSNGAYRNEIGWGYSGGGLSLYESEPSYQFQVQGTGVRTVPDVAYDADPNTGFPIYGSGAGMTGWSVVAGTSAGAPQWAGIIAIANEGRAAVGKSALRCAATNIYQLPSTDFHDIASGFNGYPARPGYDLVTGRGTPYVNRIVPDLVKTVVNPSSTGSSVGSVAVAARVKSGLTAAAKIHVHTTADASADAPQAFSEPPTTASGKSNLASTLAATPGDDILPPSGPSALAASADALLRASGQASQDFSSYAGIALFPVDTLDQDGLSLLGQPLRRDVGLDGFGSLASLSDDKPEPAAA